MASGCLQRYVAVVALFVYIISVKIVDALNQVDKNHYISYESNQLDFNTMFERDIIAMINPVIVLALKD